MISIGRLAGAHGLSGDLTLLHDLTDTAWIRPGVALMVELLPGSFIPFFIGRVRVLTGQSMLVQFEDVESAEEAKKISGRAVYVEEQAMPGDKIESPLLWKGFNVVDKTRGGLGPLTEVEKSGAQWLGTIEVSGRPVLVPLVKDLIIEVNARNRYLRMDLPEGLLDV